MLSEGINHKTYWKQVESFVILAFQTFILTLKQLLPGKDSDNRGDSSMTFMDESDKSFSSKRLVG
ncbi:MAG TPA: hypothetical protein DCX10_14975 [Verrucomicrobiales bacterium]|nr:hypothetical protein [Verrucomicrobiales bacterium]